MFNLNQLEVLLSCLVSLCILVNSVNSQSTYSYHICSNRSNPSVGALSDDAYNSSLYSLLSSFASRAADTTFYNDTSNGVYGLFLCRGDVSNSVCQKCITSAAEYVKKLCSNYKTAVIWYDQCLLRYSNKTFFGIPQNSQTVVIYNTANNTTPDEPDAGALGIIYTLVDAVPYSKLMYGASSATVMDGRERRYGLVQCTRDISKDGCHKCLIQLTKEIPNCCQGKQGWRILTPSCYLRYEATKFYEEPALPPSPVAQPDPPSGDGGSTDNSLKIVISVASAAAVVALLLCVWLSLYFRNKKKKQEMGLSQEILLYGPGNPGSVFFIEETEHDRNNSEVRYFTLTAMAAATNNFSASNKLGEGGFGPVYKGELSDGKEIAVKRLSLKSGQGLEEFKNEVMLIAKLQHRNLVKLVGCCVEKNEKLLVYEYLANTSLDAFLFDSVKKKVLNWEMRVNIVTGIAKGLLYLHEDSRLKIIHRDLKASNVLLDDEMNPKISDFGTARIFEGNQIEANTNRVVGTYGYMAPEYAMEGLFSVKSDVYSFGILLLEIISGRKNSGFSFPNRAQSLLSYAWKMWTEKNETELIDETIINDCPVNIAMRWIHIALLCVQEDLTDRPNMSSVVLMLGSENVDLPSPSTPPLFSTGKYLLSDQSTTSGTKVLDSDRSSTSMSV